ncbi:MAG: hypothetical protein H6658_01835 [Ardenticatenaceae bacterium]|nr:hypothetical protein [Ardenticatenaceae bacterium]
MVRIQLLGSAQIEKDGQAVRDLRSQKALGLLGYLCLQRQPITRPYLVELFWPDMTEERGRRNLSWALSQLSRYLADCFESTRQTVQFVGSSDVWLDVAQAVRYYTESCAIFAEINSVREWAVVCQNLERLGATKPV